MMQHGFKQCTLTFYRLKTHVFFCFAYFLCICRVLQASEMKVSTLSRRKRRRLGGATLECGAVAAAVRDTE